MTNPIYPSTIPKYARGRQRVPNYVTGLAPLSPVVNAALDHFTGTDTTNLTAHTMDVGGGWTANAGSVTIVSNKAVCQSGSNNYTCNPGYHNVKIVCKFTCGAANANLAPTILFRGTDATHCLMAYFSGDGAGLLIWRNGGAFNTVGTFIWAADTTEHTATITAVGTTITIQIDSGMVWTWDNIKQMAGGTLCGIYGFVSGASKDTFDDFQVYAETNSDVFPYPFLFNPFTDPFTQADNTRLGTFGWTEDVGTWQVTSNKATQTSATSPTNGYVVSRDVGFSDVGLEVAITTPATGGFVCGLVFRCQDKNNYIECELNTSGSGFKGLGLWYTNNSGTYTELASLYFVPANNTTYTLRVRAKGTLIIGEIVENSLRIQANCGMFLNATKVGLFEARSGSYPNANSYDNFKVYNQ